MFLIGLMLLTSNAHGDDYVQSRKWNVTPKIMICKNSKTTVQSVKSAANFWKKEGYSIGSIVKEKNAECNDNYEYGYILISGNYHLDTSEKYGETTPWLIQGTKTQVGATVDLSSLHANNVKLLRHEIGHGLGLDHVHVVSNVMYPYANY